MIKSHSMKNIKFILLNNTAPFTLVVLLILSAFFVPNFLTTGNISTILLQYSVIGFLALGQMLIILTGGFDLSQGSMVAFTSVIIPVIMSPLGLIPAILAGLLLPALLGLISGFLVSHAKMPPFIVTLGMMGIIRALALTVANSKPVPIKNEIFTALGSSKIWVVPLPAVLFLTACVLLHLFLRHRKLGRHIYAIGSSENSAMLSGINVKNVKLFIYVMSALLTSIGGFIWCAWLTSGSPIGAEGYEMESIAAVAIGGADLLGGRGTVLGTLSGVLIFGVISSVLNLLQIPPFWQGTVKGIMIIFAVLLSMARRSDNTVGRG